MSRDAQGNVLAIYQKKDNNFTWKKQHLYGSSRLGIWKAETRIQGTYKLNVAAMQQSVREYELTNHLGNVLSTITDKGVITSAQDYFPFGLTLASRSFTEGGSSYRYSFNGKEDDKALKQQDYGARINRPDLGRFLSVDPLTQEYPWYTPYQFAGNKPIWAIDLDGLEELFATEILFRGRSFISFKYNQRVQSNDIGTMQYTYLDGSRVPINIPIRVISPSEIAELYNAPQKLDRWLR